MNLLALSARDAAAPSHRDLRSAQWLALALVVVAVHAGIAAIVLLRVPDAQLPEQPHVISVALVSPSPDVAEPVPVPAELPARINPPVPPVNKVAPPVPRQSATHPLTPPVLGTRQAASAQDRVVSPVADARAEPALAPAPVPVAQTQPAPAAAPTTAPTAAEAPRPPLPSKAAATTATDYLNPPTLAYPRVSRELGESGTVRLRVLVDEQGRPRDIEVARSSGYPRLDQAAINAMRATRFKPHLEAGVPQSRWVLTPLTFNLEEQ